MSWFDDIGGEPALRAIVDDFIDRCFDDVMIGFMFRRASRERVKRFEYEHAAELLGAPLRYGGRPLEEAHRRHRILGGQFDRRLQILRETLQDHEVPDVIREAWLAHQQSLRARVTSDPDSNCRD
ncbi:MAG: group I truncated hemoglobin [Myxococcota bacterium]